MARWEVNWRCLDCGVNTSKSMNDYYMVKDEVWLKANPCHVGSLCLKCLRRRLNRPLKISDFTDVIVNSHITKEVLTNL